MKGGVFNCPECGHLQSAGRHSHDVFWNVAYWGGVILGAAVGVGAIVQGHAPLGMTVLAVTALIALVAAVWG